MIGCLGWLPTNVCDHLTTFACLLRAFIFESIHLSFLKHKQKLARHKYFRTLSTQVLLTRCLPLTIQFGSSLSCLRQTVHDVVASLIFMAPAMTEVSRKQGGWFSLQSDRHKPFFRFRYYELDSGGALSTEALYRAFYQWHKYGFEMSLSFELATFYPLFFSFSHSSANLDQKTFFFSLVSCYCEI